MALVARLTNGSNLISQIRLFQSLLTQLLLLSYRHFVWCSARLCSVLGPIFSLYIYGIVSYHNVHQQQYADYTQLFLVPSQSSRMMFDNLVGK